ncbi:MAG: hypothetical protein U9R19_13425 [Bacteroidota bacterium]|nr:hypothetical protein [Bacteroidota bacterium]
MVEVNVDQSKKLGRSIRRYNVRQEFLSRPFLCVKIGLEHKLRGIFYAVAICHQTYSLAFRDKNIYGWEVLELVFYNLMNEGSDFLIPGNISKKSIAEIASELQKIFRDNNDSASCTLDRLEERANLLIDFDSRIGHYYNGRISDLLSESNSMLFNKGKGLYEILDHFEAFSDPFRKKSSFLIKLLQDADLIEISDPENFIPVMDYHIQRVLMRSGCVDISDRNLYKKLAERQAVEDDTPIREACIESMKIIALESGHSIAAMNDFFWPLGRSCCNKYPLCEIGSCEKSPCSLTRLITLEHPHKKCILDEVCKGKSDIHYRNLWQPLIKTHYY